MNYYLVHSYRQHNSNYWIHKPHQNLIKSERDLTEEGHLLYVTYWCYYVPDAIWHRHDETHFYGYESITKITEEKANKIALAFKLQK